MTISADHTAQQDQTGRRRSRGRRGEAVRKFGITVEDYMLPARHQIQMVGPDGTLNPHTEQGTQPGHEYALPGDEELLAAYEQLVVGRRVNDQNSALVRQGRMAVYPSSHGQEACQVAAALCLSDGDWMFPTYRDSVAVMARGVDPVQTLTLLPRRLALRLRPRQAQGRHPVHPAGHPAAARASASPTPPSCAARTPWSWPCAATAPPARATSTRR